MPTYEYECDACGHKFEEFQSFTADPLKTCPKCQADALRRLFGIGAAVLFKGSGFYQTDYRSESYKSAAKSDGGSSGTGDSKGGDGGGAAAKPADSGGTSGTAPAKADG